CRKADFTLRGLVAELAERGLKVDYRTVWEFVHAEKLSHKKRRCLTPSRTSPTWLAAVHNGPSIGSGSIPPAWCSLTRPGQNQHGTAAGLGAARPADQSQGATWSLADHDLPGRFAPRSHHCSLAHRGADQ